MVTMMTIIISKIFLVIDNYQQYLVIPFRPTCDYFVFDIRTYYDRPMASFAMTRQLKRRKLPRAIHIRYDKNNFDWFRQPKCCSNVNDIYGNGIFLYTKLDLNLKLGDGYLHGDANATDSMYYKINIQQG